MSATKTRFETHDGGVWVLRGDNPDLDIIKPIKVGSNVYFGYGCVVLPGVTIGDNVVVGAGAVVSRDIPSNCVAVGVPARVIRSIEEYSERSVASGISTKRLAPLDKRKYLEARYKDMNEQGN
ncbi:DapH/DapD/GlmU-related protein [Microbacterium sp. A1-JK]|uniref:DapH/DapD/GlmU-related protein n=1 Tax=Microbacterium sp. A1-JK TaxID=3177516 RepID=UPI0038843F10